MQLNPDWKQLYTDKAYTSVIKDDDVFMLGRPDPNLALGYRTLAISKQDLVNQLGGVNFLTTKISLTASQIKTLFSKPILVVPSPGPGYLVKGIGLDIQYNYVSGGWSAGGSNVSLGNDITSAQNNATYHLLNDISVDNNLSSIFVMAGYQNNVAILIPNTGLYVKFDSQDSTTLGTGSFDIYVTYQVIKL